MLCVVKDGGVRAGQKRYGIGETVELSDSEAARLEAMGVVVAKPVPVVEPEADPIVEPESPPATPVKTRKKGKRKNGR